VSNQSLKCVFSPPSSRLKDHLDFTERIVDLTDSDSAITHEPLPPQDPQVRQPDIAKARSELGWEPDVSLRDGLRESIAYFRSVV